MAVEQRDRHRPVPVDEAVQAVEGALSEANVGELANQRRFVEQIALGLRRLRPMLPTPLGVQEPWNRLSRVVRETSSRIS